MDVKKSVVKSVVKKDMFNELYKFEVSMEDGTTGMMYKKSENPFVGVGDEVLYGINSKGTIKIIPKGSENKPYTPNTAFKPKDDNRDDIIMIQTMLKSSAEYHGRRQASKPSDVMDTAQIWYEFCKSIVSGKSDVKPVVIEKTPVTNNQF